MELQISKYILYFQKYLLGTMTNNRILIDIDKALGIEMNYLSISVLILIAGFSLCTKVVYYNKSLYFERLKRY